MNVETVLSDHDSMTTQSITVTGRLVGFDGNVFLVAANTPTEERHRALFIARDEEFSPKYGEVVVPAMGAPLYEVSAEVTGVIGPSSIPPFPLAFVELHDVKVPNEHGTIVSVPL